jgi:hypothetical protein
MRNQDWTPAAVPPRGGLTGAPALVPLQALLKNNLAHDGGIAANPREHAISVPPPWRGRDLDAVDLLHFRSTALRAPAARAIGATGAALAQQAARVAAHADRQSRPPVQRQHVSFQLRTFSEARSSSMSRPEKNIASPNGRAQGV